MSRLLSGTAPHAKPLAKLLVATILASGSIGAFCQSIEFDVGPVKKNLLESNAASPGGMMTIGNPAASSTANSATSAVQSAPAGLTAPVAPATSRATSPAAAAGSSGTSDQSNQAGQPIARSLSDNVSATGNSAAPGRDGDTSPGSKTSVRSLVGDSILTTKVKAAMLADASVKGSQISVETDGGDVTLSGTVSSAQEIAQAEKIASKTSGVKTVVNKLTLKNK